MAELVLSPAYVASKFALEGLSESMRYEANKFGINIVIIKPGVIKTNALANSESAHTRSISPYADLIERATKALGVFNQYHSSPPKLVAEAILSAITSKEPGIRYLVGDDAESIIIVRNNTSDKEFENWMYESVLLEKGYVRDKEI